MRTHSQKFFSTVVILILLLLAGSVLLAFSFPMREKTLDLSLIARGELIAAETTDEKGWEVFTQEGDTVTYLEPNGYGFYLGIELGQTLYMSRVMSERLDDPTLQLGAAERTFSVWLDDTLIYTDCPELDNRIGHLRLPTGAYRQEPVIITLPPSYLGKTLTIAHSTPEYSETPTLKAAPASVVLYCGYAYESGLIAESYSLAIKSAGLFAIGLLLLAMFFSRRDWSLVPPALIAFLAMYLLQAQSSFYYRYFGINAMGWHIRWFIALALLAYLTAKAKHRCRLLKGLTVAAAAYTPVSLVLFAIFRGSVLHWPVFLFRSVPEYLFLLGLGTALVSGLRSTRRESPFYRVFAPSLLAALAVYWTVMLFNPMVPTSIAADLKTASASLIFNGTLSVSGAVALAVGLWDGLKTEMEHRTEKKLMAERRELALSSYENLRRQHAEVMVLRHDMRRHLTILQSMEGDGKRTEYLTQLIGQQDALRPIVESGNEMLDIILNGKLGAAIDAGIRVELPRISAPEKLPLSDPDLCSLIMNIVDNAIAAAPGTESGKPYIKLSIREKDGYWAVVCKNSTAAIQKAPNHKKEALPGHGLGLKIIGSIVRRYEGVLEVEDGGSVFTVKVVIPLN